jgi:thiol-disulfide isomerase/thioredoxin
LISCEQGFYIEEEHQAEEQNDDERDVEDDDETLSPFTPVDGTANRESDYDQTFAMRLWDGEVKWDDDVAILNARNFERFVRRVPHVLVQFYAPWCGHCKKFEPIYQRAASHLHMEVI